MSPTPSPQQRPLLSDRVESAVLLQAYNWHSWRTRHTPFFRHLESKSHDIKRAGIDAVWLPPCSKSVSPQGYMPMNLYELNSEYGSESDLRRCVQALKDQEVDVLADIVINHRCAEFQNADGIYNVFGGRLCWDDTAIVSNDEAFRGKGNRSDFKLFEGAPNIDHSQEFVRRDLIEWMRWMRDDVGFDGFRFDFMTGIDPVHMREYFARLGTDVCIGEYWDSMAYEGTALNYDQNAHRQRIVDWIDRSGQRALAFDMTTKGVLQEALKNGEYWRLADKDNQPPGVLGWWKSRSVTFLDNHDTHRDSQNHWPFPVEHVLERYAYILTHPGVQMVYWDDLCRDHTLVVITALSRLRNEAGINASSVVRILEASDRRYSAVIDDTLRVTLGATVYKSREDTEHDDRVLFVTDRVLIERVRRSSAIHRSSRRSSALSYSYDASPRISREEVERAASAGA